MDPHSTQTHCLRGFFYQILRVALLSRVDLHDLILEATCTQTSRQLPSRSLPSDEAFPLLVAGRWLLPSSRLAQVVTVIAKKYLDVHHY